MMRNLENHIISQLPGLELDEVSACVDLRCMKNN